MKDYTFDFQLQCSTMVEAASEAEARRIIKGIIVDAADLTVRERADNDEEITGECSLIGDLTLVEDVVEIRCFGMRHTSGHSTLAKSHDDIQFYDVIARRATAAAGGRIKMLEELDDIPTKELADKIVALLELKYPGAEVEYLP